MASPLGHLVHNIKNDLHIETKRSLWDGRVQWWCLANTTLPGADQAETISSGNAKAFRRRKREFFEKTEPERRTIMPPIAPPAKKKNVRQSSERVQGLYKICYDHRQKHLADPEGYSMTKAAHDAMKLLPKNYLGQSLEEQTSRLRKYANRYKKPKENGGGQT